MSAAAVILCPGQGAQAVGMGKTWHAASPAARSVFAEADATLGDALGAPLSQICFHGPAERLNQTDVSQPAIYVCSVASHRGLAERQCATNICGTAGLSLGEYTSLHLAGVFGFADGLRAVAQRGRLMQEAAASSRGGMVALIGADDTQAQSVCDRVVAENPGEVLVCANYNAPGQIVLSGSAAACASAVQISDAMGLKATALTVAGAFHSPLMQPAADRMAEVLETVTFQKPNIPVWSNVTGKAHDSLDPELLKVRLVQQIVSPVRWSQSCLDLASQVKSDAAVEWHELAPGSVLRGLIRRIDRSIKVLSHDEP